jgi:NDP-sugar pyrophosphorylase family protein
MAGRGTRTNELGLFKPFIEVANGRMVEWLLSSLKVHFGIHDRIVFVTTRPFENEFEVTRELGRSLRKMGVDLPFEVVLAPEVPQGPAKSVSLAIDALKGCAGAVIVVNVDQYIDFERLELADGAYGFLPIYAEFTQKASYVELQEGRIRRVVEKHNISNLASAGVYGVSSVALFRDMLDQLFKAGEATKGEFYVGPAYNFLIRSGIPVFPAAVMAKFDLGNLQGIERFRRRVECKSPNLGRSGVTFL